MEKITLTKCEDGMIWVTSNEDAIGLEITCQNDTDKNKQMMIALAAFLGYKPSDILNFDCE